MKAIINGRIISDGTVMEGMVLLFDDKITGIVHQKQFKETQADVIYDAEGRYVSPGFIDIHTHGAVKFDVMDGTREAIDAISGKFPAYGVTGFLPTTMTMEWDMVEKALKNIREAMKSKHGARVLGCNLEGPFISKKYYGAHNPDYIMNPDFSMINEFKDIIKIVTVAPELENSQTFIKDCTRENIVVSIGHSEASNDITKMAIESGAKSTTHTFNAMPPLHHRNPGILGTVMADGNVYCELIADNIHVHPDIQKVLLSTKGINRIILVTDSMRAAAMGKGIYELGGQKVFVDECSARLENGTLAGSILTIDTALRNFKQNTGTSIQEVIKTVTENPSRLLGISSKKGSLKPGYDADIVSFDDRFNVYATFVEGTLCYEK